jgi:two-component system, OmpR family, response regulator
LADILLLEDDGALAREIVGAFASEGMRVDWITDLGELPARLRASDVSVAILDRMIGAVDSLATLALLRAEGVGTPVIVVSSLAGVDERIRGLRDGGDDYLTKPFAMGELIARVVALVRRSARSDRTVLAVGPLRLDMVARSATCCGHDLDLFPREFSLLACLMRHDGEVLTRAMLLEEVWNYRSSVHTNVIDVHVSHLRRKIEAKGGRNLIRNVRGVGFVLDASDAAS